MQRHTLLAVLACVLPACTTTVERAPTTPVDVSGGRIVKAYAAQRSLQNKLIDYDQAFNFWLRDDVASAVIEYAQARRPDGHLVDPHVVCSGGTLLPIGHERIPKVFAIDAYCSLDAIGDNWDVVTAWDDFTAPDGVIVSSICENGGMLRNPDLLNLRTLPPGTPDIEACRNGTKNYASTYAQLQSATAEIAQLHKEFGALLRKQ